jgi:hypothetical protein
MKMIFEPTLSEVQQCARICHEVHRAYAFSIGDSSQPHWYNASQEAKVAAIDVVKAHLDSGLTMSAETWHDTWLAMKKAAGWRYGDYLDNDKKRDPRMLPYIKLPQEQRTKDWLVRAAVHAFFHSHFEEVK